MIVKKASLLNGVSHRAGPTHSCTYYYVIILHVTPNYKPCPDQVQNE